MPHFGTRITVYFLLRALTEYARHKVNVDEDLSPAMKTAMEALLDLAADIAALNPPGPE
jgi:quinolinate synthase